MTTVQDVARAAGVSTATVSRVLSNTGVVTEGTRRRVLEAVAELGYAPNVAARALRTTRTSKLLATVPNISNTFFANVIRGVEEAAREAGYSVLLGDTHGDPRRADDYAAMLAGREADGMIVLGHGLPGALMSRLGRTERPPPLVSGCFVATPGLPGLHIDGRRAACEALEAIYAHGHTRVGIITGSLAIPLHQQRLDGVWDAAKARRLVDRVAVHSIEAPLSPQAAFAGMQRLLEAAPDLTAVFCFSDEVAIGALAAARAAGLACPEDISVMGFDDIKFAEMWGPPLATVRQPAVEIGRGVVGLLLAILTDPAPPREPGVAPHEIVPRASLGPAPSGRR